MAMLVYQRVTISKMGNHGSCHLQINHQGPGPLGPLGPLAPLVP